MSREPTAAYVGLGSNVGDRLAHLRAAVRCLAEAPDVVFVRSSAVYETEPVGPPQPEFLNAVVELETSLEPLELLDVLKGAEHVLGRAPRERHGPREIDLDLLLHGEALVDEPTLRVPHPEMTGRAFVLVPLADLAPFARIPGDGRLVAEFLEAADRTGVRLVHPPESLWPER